ncbi:DUF4386 domain-containing protein [Candidatus Villigracilis affinis]|uniref:DUF4386 domain-containing protein n=1 Tax=Candidatus Villigracilis affinis TaxID=3140682 RepID=UPI002A1D6D65|nr:DUF4386 domain-containing protein [Anaerolineales bacterium]
MKTQISEISPQVYARVVGILYLFTISAGIIAQMGISNGIVVVDDAATTASNILANRNLFQLGFTIYLLEMASQIAQTVIFYMLLKPAGRSVSLLALFFGLVGCIIKTVSRLFYIAPLLVLGEAHYLDVFTLDQLQALALLLLRVNDLAAGMALAFFGFSTLLNGFLIFRSTFLPRILGILSILGGFGWLTFLYPPLGNQLLPYILVIALIGSISQILWLLTKGVRVEQWKRLAGEST